MRNQKFILIVLILSVSVLTVHCGNSKDDTQRKQNLTADINCDGIVDSISTKYSDNKFIIEFYYSIDSSAYKKQTESFVLATQSVQNGLCGNIAHIEFESMDYNLFELIGNIDGFKQSKNCTGLNLHTTDGGCDPFHYFWNHKNKRMEWWRL